MHVGVTAGPALGRPFLHLDGEGPHGACSADGRIMGGYVHGMFEAGAFRQAFVGRLGARSSGLDHGDRVDQALDEIADQLATHLDIAALARIAGLETFTV
jgi:adenosylcobyric acid synthase